MQSRASLATLALGTADLGALAWLAPDVPAVAGVLRHPHHAVARGGADAALATVAGAAVWLAAVWLALGLLAAAASRIPGAPGRAAAAVGRRLLPRALRATLAGSAGLTVLLAPATALAHASHPGPAGITPGAAVPSPAWPVNPADGRPPAWPTTRPPASPPASPRPHSHPDAATADGATVVRPGDSLWTIAAHRLGPGASAERIATAWPRWFAANRAVIGDDPSLIRPGQVLQPPDPAPGRQENRP